MGTNTNRGLQIINVCYAILNRKKNTNFITFSKIINKHNNTVGKEERGKI